MSDNMPLWAVEIKTMVARIDAKLDAHLDAHRELRRTNQNDDLKRLIAFGLGIGSGMGGAGIGLLKLLG